jgi:predicted ester cyclase
MSVEANKELVLAFVEEVMNQRNVTAIPKYFVAGTFLAGSLENLVRGMSMSFPDYHITIEDVIAEGDKVVVRTTLRGINTGSFFGHPPTGRPALVGNIHIYKFKDGKIVSEARESNMLILYQQLGISPVIEPA